MKAIHLIGFVVRCRRLWIAAVVAGIGGRAVAANQTADLSPVIVGGAAPIGMQIQAPQAFPGATLPTLHSFVDAIFESPADGHGLWVVMGGMTNGLHDLSDAGFDPAAHNRSVYVIDPVGLQVWGRSLDDLSSGLSAAQVESITTTNAQSTQIGSRLYVAGGYGFSPGLGQYHTYDTLSAFDLGAVVDWVRDGTGSLAAGMRQIRDPLVQVTGGDMSTTPNGKTHLVFGQDYPDSYNMRQEGIYTKQVRTFEIVDDGTTLAITNAVAHPASDDYRRRDLNVVPTITSGTGGPVAGLQALSGVFTPSFGVWTVPVSIDADGNATQPDPAAPTTFKQGMNGYHSAVLSLYSANDDTMHQLLLGGISYQYYDAATGLVMDDAQIPFISSVTDVVTTPDGVMSQHLLDVAFPAILAPSNGEPYLLGANATFFPADGITTYANGVIDLDALTGPTLVGWVFGGIAADAPNHGVTVGSNAMFPVIITPVPEPSAAFLLAAVACGGVAFIRPMARRRLRRPSSRS